MLAADQRRSAEVQTAGDIHEEPPALSLVSRADRETGETTHNEIIARRREPASHAEQPVELIDGRVRAQLPDRALERRFNASQPARVSRRYRIARANVNSRVWVRSTMPALP